MVVIVLTACPAGLRGYITRWLLEISPGVFVGRVSARIREAVWDSIVENCGLGKAIMVFSAKNEQRLDFKVHNHDWETIDLDGVKLMLRPSKASESSNGKSISMVPDGWSVAARRRKFGREAESKRRQINKKRSTDF